MCSAFGALGAIFPATGAASMVTDFGQKKEYWYYRLTVTVTFFVKS